MNETNQSRIDKPEAIGGNADSLPITHDPSYRPALRTNVLIDPIESEAIAWNPAMPDPTYLDPVATLLVQVLDGHATAADLINDISESLDVETAVAAGQLQRVLELLAHDDLLVRPDGGMDLRPPKRHLLPDPDW